MAVSGDADQVWLVGPGGRVAPGLEVPVGSYDIHASFGGGAVLPAGKLVVVEGGSHSVACSSFAMRCR